MNTYQVITNLGKQVNATTEFDTMSEANDYAASKGLTTSVISYGGVRLSSHQIVNVLESAVISEFEYAFKFGYQSDTVKIVKSAPNVVSLGKDLGFVDLNKSASKSWNKSRIALFELLQTLVRAFDLRDKGQVVFDSILVNLTNDDFEYLHANDLTYVDAIDNRYRIAVIEPLN